jgi:hypothetical protein
MALEFAMSLEESFGIQVAMTSSIGTLTVSGLVNEIICQLDLVPTEESTMAKSVAERHFEKAEPREIAALEELVSAAATKVKGARS